MQRPTGTPTDSTASSASSSGTPGIVVITIRAPTNHPPRPSTTAYSDRSTAPDLRPKGSRLCTRRAISHSDSSVRNARPTIVPAMPLASTVCVSPGVKSTVARV